MTSDGNAGGRSREVRDADRREKGVRRDREIFDLDEFLARPLYAHLAHNGGHGPCESPVWFHWDGRAVWIIGGTSFPTDLKRDPRCALGIVDWDAGTGQDGGTDCA